MRGSKIEYKQTELGLIPVGWEVARLGEVAEINKESRDPTKESTNHKFIYIDIDSVENETGVIRNAKEIIGKDAPSRARRVIHHNDILMSTVRPYLKAFTIVPRYFHNQICSTGFAVLTCRDRIIPLYLFQTLFTKSVLDQCKKMMVGGQYPALSTSQVENIRIPIPPLPEQNKIAEILETVDQGIEKVDQAIKKTQKLKKGLMQDLLTKGIGHKEFKDTEIGRIPKEWEVVKLGEIIKYEKGKKPKILFDREEKNTLPYLSAETLRTGAFTQWGTENRELIKVNNDNVILIWDGYYCGDSFIGFEGLLSSTMIKIEPKNQNLNKRFLFYFLKACFKELNTKISGMYLKHVNKFILESQNLPLPPLHEQQKIAEILSGVDRRLELLRKRRERLERVKKGLMEDLLTGKVRVTKLINSET
jgi:type I restriction enzyme S subunit